MSARWDELDDQIIARLKTGTVVKNVVSAASPNAAGSRETAFPSVVIASFGTLSADGEPWAVELYQGGTPWQTDWILVTVSIRAKSLSSIRLARDEIRTKLQGYEPELSVDKVFIPFQCVSEVPDEALPAETLECLWRLGVASQEGEP